MKTRVALFIILACSVSTFAIRPDREYKATPTLYGINHSEYQVETPDHYNLNVWEYPATGSASTDRTIILAQTDAGNISYYIWLAKAFADRGIRVITFDYRGFGKSSDFAINNELLYYPEFATDLDSVIRATRERFPKSKVGIYGLSMGSYIGLIRKEPIDFYIADGFYHNPQLVVERIKAITGETVLLPEGTTAINKLNPPAPALIFCASKDQRTITADARAFSATSNATIVEYDGEHLHGFSKMSRNSLGDEYIARIIEFLEANQL